MEITKKEVNSESGACGGRHFRAGENNLGVISLQVTMPVDEIMWRVNVDRVVEIFTVYIKYVWKSLNTFNLETFAIHLGRLKKKKCP